MMAPTIHNQLYLSVSSVLSVVNPDLSFNL